MFDTLPCELGLVRRGTSWRDRVALLRVFSRLHLQMGLGARVGRSVPMGRARELDVDISGIASLRVRTNDVPIFEVLGCNAYAVDLSLLGDVSTVLDAGANVGFTTVYLAARLPRARFCCVEPSAASFALLEENLRRNVSRAQAVHGALVPDAGPVVVREGVYGGLTTTRQDGEGSVPGLTIPGALDRAGFDRVDLMKVDVQGAEADLFRRAHDWADRVGAIVAEIHAPLRVAEAAGLLGREGFKRLPLPPGRLFNDMLYVRR